MNATQLHNTLINKGFKCPVYYASPLERLNTFATFVHPNNNTGVFLVMQKLTHDGKTRIKSVTIYKGETDGFINFLSDFEEVLNHL